MTNACAARLLAFHFESLDLNANITRVFLRCRKWFAAPWGFICPDWPRTLHLATGNSHRLVSCGIRIATPDSTRKTRKILSWLYNHWLSYSLVLCAHASQSATVWLRSFQDWEETINHNFMIHFQKVLRKVLDFFCCLEAIGTCRHQMFYTTMESRIRLLLWMSWFLVGNVAQDDSRAMFDKQGNCVVASCWMQCKAWVNAATLFHLQIYNTLSRFLWCAYPANNTTEHFAECHFEFRQILFEHCPKCRTEARQGGSPKQRNKNGDIWWICCGS